MYVGTIALMDGESPTEGEGDAIPLTGSY